jgi:hypothetical protein
MIVALYHKNAPVICEYPITLRRQLSKDKQGWIQVFSSGKALTGRVGDEEAGVLRTGVHQSRSALRYDDAGPAVFFISGIVVRKKLV